MSSYNASRGLRSKNRRIRRKCRKHYGYDYRQLGLQAKVWFAEAMVQFRSMASYADVVSAAAARGADWHVVADQIAALQEPLMVIDYRPSASLSQTPADLGNSPR